MVLEVLVSDVLVLDASGICAGALAACCGI